MSKTLATLASIFTGCGKLSYSPNTSVGETKCPNNLL